MTNTFTQFKINFFGYLTLFIICGLIIQTNLLSMCIFFIFIYLFTDVFTNDIHKKFPKIPMYVLLLVFYISIISIATFVTITVVPIVFSDVPKHYAMVKVNFLQVLNHLSLHYGIHIDQATFKENLFNEGSKFIGQFLKIFNGVSKGFIYFLFSLILNLLIYLEKRRITAVFNKQPDSLLSYLFNFIMVRFSRFYTYFRRVMGGQVIISLINTIITLIVITAMGLPYKISLSCIVFVCGLIPVLGNIISNTILCATALASSGVMAFIVCLLLLIGIHKLEYFLNSKIIGTIIHLPMFVTLLSLLIGEAVLGLWGMIIIIPLVLTIKDELELMKY